MSGKELSRAVAHMKKGGWTVVVGDHATSYPDKRSQHSSRERAEKMRERREREGYAARVEVSLSA